MSKKKNVQRLAISCLVISVILLLPNTNWEDRASVWGLIILVFGTLGSIISIFIPTSYTFNFVKSDWESYDEGFNLHIANKKHGLGNSPHVQTFLKNEKFYEEVEVASHHDEKGNISIGANNTFDGKVIISK